MACAGVLSRENKEAAEALLSQSLGITKDMEINEISICN